MIPAVQHNLPQWVWTGKHDEVWRVRNLRSKRNGNISFTLKTFMVILLFYISFTNAQTLAGLMTSTDTLTSLTKLWLLGIFEVLHVMFEK